ncbi:MAG TPA: nuclear transport factor 2 family protein [candidate division Zixibacteria bacterium]|nr:nuclear transport factor 2 family protein [candidate division Zixibacteria bacterium]
MSDEASVEVRNLLTKMAEAFAEKDSEKYRDLFTKKTDVVIYGSQVGEKWTNINEYIKSATEGWKYAEKITVIYNWISIQSSGKVAWLAT